MGVIVKPGFTANIAGAQKRVRAHLEFMGSTVEINASLEFARWLVKYAPMIRAPFFANAPAREGIDAAKIELELAIKAAGG